MIPLSDRDGFLRDLLQTGSANREDYDIDERTCEDMVRFGWLSPVGRGEFVTGPYFDDHLARGFFDEGDES